MRRWQQYVHTLSFNMLCLKQKRPVVIDAPFKILFMNWHMSYFKDHFVHKIPINI